MSSRQEVEQDSGYETPNLPIVSFGSSKGSMVETLVYDCVMPEDAELSYYHANITRFGLQLKKGHTRLKSLEEDEISDTRQETPVKVSKVKVKFYDTESQKAKLPDSISPAKEKVSMSTPLRVEISDDIPSLTKTESSDSGRDNPFRPDGELSKEAESIVQQLKEGKPITPTQSKPNYGDDKSPTENHYPNSVKIEGELPIIHTTPTKILESSPKALEDIVLPEQIEVQHGIVVPAQGDGQVEHVVIKKKAKCKCCGDKCTIL